MSLRIFRRLDARVPLLATADSALRFENFRAPDRPHRYPHRSAPCEVQGAPRSNRHRRLRRGARARVASPRAPTRELRRREENLSECTDAGKTDPEILRHLRL